MSYQLNKVAISLTILSAFYLGLSIYCPLTYAQSSNTFLKGTVNEQNYLPGQAPSLNLKDLSGGKDAFGASETPSLPSVGETFEPPPSAFKLSGQKEGSTQDQFSSAVPGLDNSAAQSFKMSAEQSEEQTPGLSNEQAGSADPDNTPEMQLAWDQWHKRVAEAIYQKFNALAQLAFKYSHPLACYATYVVTSDGRVMNAQLQRQSDNVAFNAMVMMVINSMSGDTNVLAFPPGSRRTMVNKAGMFTQNYGVQGFKYTTGDKEIIPAH